MREQIKVLLGCGLLSLLLASSPQIANAAAPRLRPNVLSAKTLAWTEWTLDSPTYAGLEKAPVLKFADNQLNASVGLNSIFGGYTVDGNKITVKPLGSTKMAGPKSEMQAEIRYAKALQSVRRFDLSANGGRLTLQGDKTLTFHLANHAAQTKQNNLAWTGWALDSPTFAGLKKPPVLLFSENQVHASVGLNSLFGSYTLDAQKITVQPLASTMMAGPEEIMQAESRYIKALQGVRSFEVSENGERLTLHGDQTLTFHATNNAAPIKSNTLAGTKWELISPKFTGLEKAPVITFADNRLNASVGLNSIFGDYTTDAQKIIIQPLASTKMAGPKPVMQAENHYIKALQSMRSFEVSANGERLTLHGDQTLTFRSTNSTPTKADPLAWTEWALTSPTYNGLKNAPILRFADKQLSASVGLNALSGAYTTDAQKINVGSFISTMMAGPKPVMDAESAYSKALQSAHSFRISENGKRLTLQGDQTLTFRLTNRTSQGFVPTATKIINVAPQLGPAMDGDESPRYLQLEDLSQGVSWGHFTEPSIIGFDFVPGYRYQLRVVVERDARSGEKRLRLIDVFSQQWMRTAKLGANDKILEVAPTKVDCGGVAPMKCLQVREADGQWTNFYAPIEGFQFQEGWRYRLQVAVTDVKNPPADGSSLRYQLVRVLDKMPVTY